MKVFILIVLLLCGLIVYLVTTIATEMLAQEEAIDVVARCCIAGVTFPASAKECARIHKAIERRIANETT